MREPIVGDIIWKVACGVAPQRLKIIALPGKDDRFYRAKPVKKAISRLPGGSDGMPILLRPRDQVPNIAELTVGTQWCFADDESSEVKRISSEAQSVIDSLK